MKALVTGAGGFIGSRICIALLAKGWKVRGVGRRAPAPALLRSGLAWRALDLTAVGPAPEDIDGADVVFHAAGKNGGAKGDAAFFFQANEATALNVFKACSGKTGKIVHASSQVVYGEAGRAAVDENFPLNGFNTPYGSSKVASELWLRHFQEASRGDAVALRLAGFVGGGGAVDHFIETASRNLPIEVFSDGEVRRDYLSIDDGIAAFLLAAEAPTSHPSFSAYNIGSGEVLSSLELARLVCREMASSSEIVPVPTRAPRTDLVMDVGKARRELGFSPAPLSEAVRSFIRTQKTQHA